MAPRPLFLGALALAVALFGCGAQPSSSHASSTQREQLDRSHWLSLAKARIGWDDSDPRTTGRTPEAYLARNRRITMAYAAHFLEQAPAGRHDWVGLAAFASKMVGGQMQRRVDDGDRPLVGRIQRDGAALLGLGNTSVYLDIFWQHLAYAGGGIDLMRTLHARGELADDALTIWELMSRGEARSDPATVWRAIVQIALVEQRDVVQPLVFDGPYARIAGVVYSHEVPSPVPGGRSFAAVYGPFANVAAFERRWAWIRDVVLPEWRAMLKREPEKVAATMAALARDG